MKKNIIQFKIYKGESQYIGESLDLPIVTQGKTMDEVIANIREAVSLHLDGEDVSRYDLAEHPAVLVNYEIERMYA